MIAFDPTDLFMGVAIGFVFGLLLARNYWSRAFNRFTEEITNQYKDILDGFGIYRTDQGIWKMRNKEGVWTRNGDR